MDATNTKALMVVARRIARERCCMSLRDLARAINVPPFLVLQWIRGEHSMKLHHALSVASAVGVSLFDLVRANAALAKSEQMHDKSI